MNTHKWDNPQLNREIIAVLEDAVTSCHAAYQDKAKSFAVILNELETLLSQLQTKMNLAEPDKNGVLTTNFAATHSHDKTEIAESHVKMVYVRLFHKDMKNLSSPTGSLAFIKPLLESVKMADKHGLAVYAKEEDVKRSLKGDSYAYATLRIRTEQDITEKRGVRIDPYLKCELLTITNVSVNDLIKLTYDGMDFPVKDNMIIRPSHL